MRFMLRLAAWGAAIALLLFGVLAVVLYLLFPRERILEEVVPRVERAVSRPVTVADAGISLWPPFGIYVSGLVLDNVAPAVRPHLLRVGEVRAQVRVWPLLRRRVHITRLDIRDLEFDYEQFDDTTTNISDIGGGEGGMIPLLAEHLRVERASMASTHHADGTSWNVERCTFLL